MRRAGKKRRARARAEEGVLRRFRGPGRCELCGADVRDRHGHHVVSRGAGGPTIDENLVALCAAFAGGAGCHDLVHSNDRRRPGQEALVGLVARRTGLAPEEVWERIRRAVRRRTRPE